MQVYSITVTAFTIKRQVVGFHVAAVYRAPFDDMFDTIDHPAVFSTRERAEAFAVKLQAKNIRHELNLGNWIFSNHPCAGVQRTVNSPAFYSVLN